MTSSIYDRPVSANNICKKIYQSGPPKDATACFVDLEVYRMLEFSGMLMMCSSASPLGFCCWGEQDLNKEGKGSVLIFMKCFSDASSLFSMQL